MKRCVIFGGGEISDQRYARNLITPQDYIICADSGYSYCYQLGIIPDLVLGDFDSYRGDVSKDCEIIRYEEEKNDTDTMLAVKTAISRDYTNLLLLGMAGGRLDHTFANIQTIVYAVKHGASAVILDKDLLITAISSGQNITLPYHSRNMVSVFSHSDVCKGVCIRHAKYQLENHTIYNDFPLGVSNRFLKDQIGRAHV